MNTKERLALKILDIVGDDEVTPQEIRDSLDDYNGDYLKNTLRFMVQKEYLVYEGGSLSRGHRKFVSWPSVLGKTRVGGVANEKRWNRVPGSVS